MASIDKLYDDKDNVVIRLDVYSNKELLSFISQISMYFEIRKNEIN